MSPYEHMNLYVLIRQVVTTTLGNWHGVSYYIHMKLALLIASSLLTIWGLTLAMRLLYS